LARFGAAGIIAGLREETRMRKSLMALTALSMGFAAPLAWIADSSAQSLQTWNGTITYKNQPYNFTMVGTDPSTTNITTTIPVYIIPIKMVFQNGTSVPYVFDPSVDEWNGMSVVNAVVNSPLFQTMDWQWGGTDMGTTQYLDAFQRGSFWQDVSVNTDYHVLLAAPDALQEQTINVTSAQGKVVFDNGQPIGDIQKSDFDADLQALIGQFLVINPAAVAVFVTDNVQACVLAQCQPGYHKSINNSQTYLWGSFFTYAGAGVPDISSLTHELGEWMDDPFVLEDSSPCGYLEVGDPLEGHWVNSSSDYHLQALAFMRYFGEPAGFSVNRWFDDVDDFTKVCQAGQ
jgi:hypothetical protein